MLVLPFPSQDVVLGCVAHVRNISDCAGRGFAGFLWTKPECITSAQQLTLPSNSQAKPVCVGVTVYTLTHAHTISFGSLKRIYVPIVNRTLQAVDC